MRPSLHLPPEIHEALDHGVCILTANHRSARTLRRLFDLDRHASGRSTWTPPPIHAWETWTTSLFDHLVLSGHATSLLLNPTQQAVLWRDIIAADPHLRTLHQPEALASLAADAWRLLHAHRHIGPLTGTPESTDEIAFRRWSATFRTRCRRDSLLTSAELDNTLREAVTAGHLHLPHTALLLVGFDRLTPAQQDLLDAIARSGLPVTHHHPTPTPRTLHWTSAPTPDEELLTCAHWVRSELDLNPAARLAIIVPNLEADRSSLERTLRHIAAPSLHNIDAPSDNAPFEFSLGRPLGQTASVTVALDLLAWTHRPLPSSTISHLLLSPFLAGPTFAAERLPRAAFDATRTRHIRTLRPELSLRTFLAQIPPSSLPGLHTSLRNLDRTASTHLAQTSERTYTDWTEAVRALLDAAGWIPSGETSLEYQIRRRWETSLDDLSTLDITGRPVTFAQAIADLGRIAHATVFAPETHDAPVQILGPLEAAGSTFHGIWFLRCGDLTFPPSPTINPLLPWHLRHALRLPGSTPAEDDARADRLVERIAASAPDVIFSHATHTEAGRQRLAPAARKLPLTELPSVLPSLSAASEIARTLLEPISDLRPLPTPPDVAHRGGASLLEDQARCGFRAFAQHRLASRRLEDPAFGLSAGDRGNVIHDVLDRFWKEVKTQEHLNRMSPEDRASALRTHIDKALEPWSAAADTPWDIAYLDTQRDRLQHILGKWLDEELLRSPFKVVSREQIYNELPVGPLRLNVRVDRIDRTSEGTVLIDYKTGNVTAAKWRGDRPDLPQLPLYAMLPEAQTLDAIAFAIIRPGSQMGFSGLQSRPGVFPSLSIPRSETLADQQARWRSILERLASEFHAGDTSVHPKNYPSACTHCAHRLLCRLNPDDLIQGIEDEMEETTDRG